MKKYLCSVKIARAIEYIGALPSLQLTKSSGPIASAAKIVRYAFLCRQRFFFLLLWLTVYLIVQ